MEDPKVIVKAPDKKPENMPQDASDYVFEDENGDIEYFAQDVKLDTEAQSMYIRVSESTERDPAIIKKMFSMLKSTDPKEKEEADEWLVSQMCPIISAVAWFRFGGYLKQYGDDLRQVPWLTIGERLEGFDPEKGSMFTYFSHWCAAEMSKFVATYVKQTSSYLSAIISKLSIAQMRLAEKGIETPTITDYAMVTGLRPVTVKHALAALNFGYQVSIESPQAITKPTSFGYNSDPETAVFKNASTKTLINAIESLPPLPRKAISMIFGVLGYEIHTRKEAATALGLSSSELNQILNIAFDRIRNNSELKSFEGSPADGDTSYEYLSSFPIFVTPDETAHRMLRALSAIDNSEDPDNAEVIVEPAPPFSSALEEQQLCFEPIITNAIQLQTVIDGTDALPHRKRKKRT